MLESNTVHLSYILQHTNKSYRPRDMTIYRSSCCPDHIYWQSCVHDDISSGLCIQTPKTAYALFEGVLVTVCINMYSNDYCMHLLYG